VIGSPIVRIEGVTKRFGAITAVDKVDLVIERGELFALLGSSGCGKTTLLRLLAGFETPDAGRLIIDGQDMTGVPPHLRPINMMFQSYALFPHMSVMDNVAFGLRRRGDKDFRKKAQDALDLVELGSAGTKKPNQLSGGMQQRVALARALVNRPDVLLLDEPLGALDLKLRRQMQIELKRIQQEVGLTFIHVTHDQEEAMTMADTIAVMNAGHLEQLGDPATLYEHPASTFVANFLGQSNLLRARITGPADGGLLRADVHGEEILVRADNVPEGLTDVWVGVRPEKLGLGEEAGRNHLRGLVTDVSFTGVATQYLVRMPWGFDVVVVQQNDGSARARLGETIALSWDPGREFVLDAAQSDVAGMDEVLVGG
jgi:spermidine/putrescine transport system ATP-binding protein